MNIGLFSANIVLIITETLKVKGDLATFNNLAFTYCKNISHGIVCATVNRPPQKKIIK